MSCSTCKTEKCTCETSLCTNPLIYIFKDAFSLVGTTSDNDSSWLTLSDISNSPVVIPSTPFTHTLESALIQVLSSGISISSNTFLCCSDCKSGLYSIGNVNIFGSLVSSSRPGDICCVEHQSSFASWIQFLESWYSVNHSEPKCCNTDFPEAIQLWNNASSSSSAYFYLDTLMNLGIFEGSSFGGYSGLGILFNYLQLNHPELTPEDYLNILGIIANVGITIRCIDCPIYMSSTELYVKLFKGGKQGMNPAIAIKDQLNNQLKA